MLVAAKLSATSFRLYRKLGSANNRNLLSTSVGRGPASDQSIFNAAKKIFRVDLSFLGGAGVVAVLEGNFLQGNLSGVFRLETAGDQLSGSRRETFGVGQYCRLTVYRAIVLLKLARSQAVISALGVLISQHCRDGKSPAALGTRPASQARVRHPCKPSAHSSPSFAAGGKENLDPTTFFTSWQEGGEC